MSDRERDGVPDGARLAQVFPDHPVRGRPLELELDGFARTLCELAWNPKNGTPFTVVVRAGWGRGKTTLLRRTQWMLEHPEDGSVHAPAGVREVRTLWFNAWKYPDDDTVLAGLLGAAIDRLKKGAMLDQLKHLVDSYKNDTLKALFGLAAPAPLRETILGKDFQSKYQVVHEKRAFHDTFRDLFNQVSRLLFETAPAFRDQGGLSEEQLWSEETQRRQVLAVFLDDLDRCRRERVVEVLEAINLFLDLPGVFFYLGLDWDRLVDALPETVRDSRGGGDEFLEKVVQVAFDLPEVSPTGAEGYVTGLLEGTDLVRVLGGDGEAASEDIRVLARALETRHPRHVKRFLNDLSMTLAVLRNTGRLGTGDDQLPEPAVEVSKGRRMAGRRDLFDLESRAWVEIPRGTFWMGAQKDDPDAPGYDPEADPDEAPVHKVTVGPFSLARHPVTNAEYAVFVEEREKDPAEYWANGSIPQGKEQHPVVNVSWKDATEFSEWLSGRVSKVEDEIEIRLPSEAEWEYAARGKEGRRYPWGNDKPNDRLANFGMLVGDTTPVGSYQEGATSEGVQDLAGNVLEWCADRYRPYGDSEPNEPAGSDDDASRVLRGGSFSLRPRYLRAAYRRGGRPASRSVSVGFRVLVASSRGLV